VILVEADQSEDWDSSTDWSTLAERAASAAIAASHVPALIDSPIDVEVSIRFADDETVRALNARWRGKDKPTNVLSFPMIEPELLGAIASGGEGEALLGDIVLAHGVCAREAADKGIAEADHASHLVVHGMLHLLGYDHEDGDEEAEAMESVERHALASLGIADPYAADPLTAAYFKESHSPNA
jgi:probable rRNA maturation factor